MKETITKELDLEKVLAEIGPQFAATAADHDAADSFVGENYDMLRELRVFSAQVPRELGGGGVRHSAMCDFLRRLAHFCPATALALSMHQHLVAAAAANARAGRPGKPLLEKVGAGELILVSTGANDWLDSNGTAEAVEGGFRVSAVKPFASGVPRGDVLITSAAFDPPDGEPQVLHFPLPLNSEGVQLMDDWYTLGMRGTGSRTVRLDGVFVPEAAVVLRRPRGPFHPAFAVILTVAMPLIMSVYVGIAESAARRARKLVKPDDPEAPTLLGELENRLVTAQIATEDMIRNANDLDFTPSVDLANATLVRKTIAANACIATVEKALEAAGGAGFFRRHGLERLLRDVHGGQFHPLPEKRQQRFTGRMAMGLEPVG